MILTYKIQHNRDFSIELKQAKQIAEFVVKTKCVSSSKLVSHIGLKSTIACQILRKYGRNKKIKKVHRVKLTVPGQGIKYNCITKEIYISCLKLKLCFDKKFVKINQIELDNTYAFISVTVKEEPAVICDKMIGVDLNTTGHCAVVGVPETGKIYKLGKEALHIRSAYKGIRKKLQKKKQYKKLKKLKNKESRKIKDINHKISKFIVIKAKEIKSVIKLEDLTGIRKKKTQNKKFKYALHSWSFYQLRQFIEYKAKLYGIPVVKIDPFYTSQQCSKCGLLGERIKKTFKCSHCGHVDHADANASFNIANSSVSNDQLNIDRDIFKGRLVPHQRAMTK
jgi:putative transposase